MSGYIYKRREIYHYRRRIPKELQGYFSSQVYTKTLSKDKTTAKELLPTITDLSSSYFKTLSVTKGKMRSYSTMIETIIHRGGGVKFFPDSSPQYNFTPNIPIKQPRLQTDFNQRYSESSCFRNNT